MATPLAPLHGFNSPAIPLNKQTQLPILMKRNKQLSKPINAVAATDIITSDPTQVEITWQIVAGSLGTIHTLFYLLNQNKVLPILYMNDYFEHFLKLQQVLFIVSTYSCSLICGFTVFR